MKDYTRAYYEKNAESFIVNTKECDMQNQYSLLDKHLKDRSKILDLGFGSGRDMLYFKSNGYEVYGIDYSEEFCNHAKKMGLDNIYNSSILDLKISFKVDAIWACASLLHIKRIDLFKAMENCFKLLNPDGYMYVSFKYGDFEGEKNGRYFTYMTEDLFKEYYLTAGFKLVETSISEDVRKERNDPWLNVILKK
jgi:SAM-dependent methyltransferase